jgi:hypothetical protein
MSNTNSKSSNDFNDSIYQLMTLIIMGLFFLLISGLAGSYFLIKKHPRGV